MSGASETSGDPGSRPSSAGSSRSERSSCSEKAVKPTVRRLPAQGRLESASSGKKAKKARTQPQRNISLPDDAETPAKPVSAAFNAKRSQHYNEYQLLKAFREEQ